MGQKVNPISFRLGIMYGWNSKWFSKRNYQEFLRQDLTIRKYVKNRLKDAGIAKIEIERSGNNINIIIMAAKPGVVIGRGGQGIEELKKAIKDKFLDTKTSVKLNIQEVANPNTNAELIIQGMTADLEKRMPFRRIMKQALMRIEKAGALGAKVICSGRLNGSEIARREMLAWGKLPLHTLRADVDYSRGAALTTYGKVGVKVWIYKGEKFNK